MWPALMAYIRLPMILVGNGIVIFAYRQSGVPVGVEAAVGWTTLTLTGVNLICLVLLVWRCRVEGLSLVELAGFGRETIWRDIIVGFGLSFLLGGALVFGVSITILALHPTGGLAAFETAFVGETDFTSIQLPMWLAIFSAVVFPTLNAPVEELQYRGYSQTRLIAAWGNSRKGIIVTALGFGVQHAAFAMTLTASFAYVVGFIFWGLGAGIVAQREGRLAALIIGHFISNISFGIVPLIIVLNS